MDHRVNLVLAVAIGCLSGLTYWGGPLTSSIAICVLGIIGLGAIRASWLGSLNFVLLQWLGLRLARVVLPDPGAAIGYQLMHGIVPLTGWWSSYWRLWRGRAVWLLRPAWARGAR